MKGLPRVQTAIGGVIRRKITPGGPPRLTRRQQQLVEEYHAAYPRPIRMLRSVFPKVYHAATTYGIDDDEMESAMFYRVCRAAAKFDTTRGTKFCTYANWCAKNAVLEEITSRTLKRNTPVDGKAVFSYDAGEMEGEQIVDQMEDARDRGTADGEEERLKPIKQEVGAMIEQLPPRLRQIVCMRFGIGQEKVTLRTIGMALGVSCERARQLEADAMRRMREGLKSSLIEKDRDQ